MHSGDASTAYGTKGNIGFPGSAALKAVAEAKAVRVANAQLGPGMTVTTVAIPAAR